jgi:protein TonB
MSIAAHAVIGAVIVIVPLMAADALPAPRAVIGAFTAQPSPPPPPPPPLAASPIRANVPTPVTTAAPITAAQTIEPEPASTETTASAIGSPDGVVGGISLGVVGGRGVLPDVPIPPPPSPTTPQRVGGIIKEPKKIRHVPPVYPSMAQQAHIEGIVVIEAIIGVDGRVKEARVLRSKPLLEQAALDAVRQWEFTPTTLNGVPVPVIMTVTVNFKLN